MIWRGEVNVVMDKRTKRSEIKSPIEVFTRRPPYLGYDPLQVLWLSVVG